MEEVPVAVEHNGINVLLKEPLSDHLSELGRIGNRVLQLTELSFHAARRNEGVTRDIVDDLHIHV